MRRCRSTGDTVAVVGDGAVALCGVLAAKRLGADRIIVLGHHEDRLEMARLLGATDLVSERGAAAADHVLEITNGGAKRVLECVGAAAAMKNAVSIARPGGAIGYVGAPHYGPEDLDIGRLFYQNIGLRGGVAPVRRYMEHLLDDVLAGVLDPSPVLDMTVDLDGVPEGYAAMDERRAMKVMVRP